MWFKTPKTYTYATTAKLSWKQVENIGKYVFKTSKTLELEA